MLIFVMNASISRLLLKWRKVPYVLKVSILGCLTVLTDSRFLHIRVVQYYMSSGRLLGKSTLFEEKYKNVICSC